jgi:hypothetical protein
VTGVARPWLWSLPIRVKFAKRAVIRFEEQGQESLTFERSRIDGMFEAGPMQPPRATEQDRDATAGVTLKGDARSLTSRVDLDARQIDDGNDGGNGLDEQLR